MVSSRAIIRSTLPRMVLISPLCRMSRLGWARSQLGKVLVEKRECTMAMALVKSSLLQVRIKGAQLADQEHALIDHGAAGQGAHIGVGVALLKGPADHIQPPVKVNALRQIRRAGR